MSELTDKTLKLESIQNKKQLVLGDKEFDLILRSRGKVAIQVGGSITDITRIINNDPWKPRAYPISSLDFKTGISTYNYTVDMKAYDVIACSWKMSNLDPSIGTYSVNIILLSGYDWRTYTFHLDVINDTQLDYTNPIQIDINFLTIGGEEKFGFESMPISMQVPSSMKASSRFFFLYYNPTLKYWFNPIY